jgi:hypothetical protein
MFIPLSGFVGIPIPMITVERFAELSGLPLGVCEAQADRQILPMIKLGKRRMVNLEVLRSQCAAKEFS